MKILSVFDSPGLQLSERINIHIIAGENPMAFFLLPVVQHVQSHADHHVRSLH